MRYLVAVGNWSRALLVSTCVLGLGYTYYVYSVSPDLVPIHYSKGGIPDRWGTPADLLRVHWGLIGLCTLAFMGLPALVRRLPAALINSPDKERWHSPEYRTKATARLTRWADALGTSVNLLVVALEIALSWRTPGGGPSVSPLLVMLPFLIFALGSCLWLCLTPRAP